MMTLSEYLFFFQIVFFPVVIKCEKQIISCKLIVNYITYSIGSHQQYSLSLFSQPGKKMMKSLNKYYWNRVPNDQMIPT